MAFSGKKSKEFKKAQYYVWYLGWRECRGLRGEEYTGPVVRDLIQKRQKDDLHTLTLEVTKKEIKVFQQTEKKKNKNEKLNYQPVPSKDVTFATQARSPDDDVVACIYLGYNHQTGCAVHVHVYRCDCADTAVTLVNQFNQLINFPEHQQRINKIESDLALKGQIDPPCNNNSTVALTSPGHSTRSSSSGHSDTRDPDLDRDVENDVTTPFTSVNEELRMRLADKSSAPLLLPPKDYDTLCLRHGNVESAILNKSLNKDIVGDAGGVWGDNAERLRLGSSDNGPATSAPSGKRSSQLSSGDLPSPSADPKSPRFKASLEERFRNSLNLVNQNGNDQRQTGPRSQSTASSPVSTLTRDAFPSPRGTLERPRSHHSSPQGTVDSRHSGYYVSPRSPNVDLNRRNSDFQNGRRVQRLSSNDGYSPVQDKEFPPVFYHGPHSGPSSPRNSIKGSRETLPMSPLDDSIRHSREFIPTNSPFGAPGRPGSLPLSQPDLTQSMPDRIFREYQAREESKSSKERFKKKKEKLKINHARSHSEEVVPIPQPDYDITLRVPNKPVARVSSFNYR